MKQIFTPIFFIICLIVAMPLQSQVVLNEIYSEPGAGKQEFFELYNINTSNTPSSLDAYTVISYFEEGSKKGFYVLDLPNLFVESKGYFVGPPQRLSVTRVLQIPQQPTLAGTTQHFH